MQLKTQRSAGHASLSLEPVSPHALVQMVGKLASTIDKGRDHSTASLEEQVAALEKAARSPSE